MHNTLTEYKQMHNKTISWTDNWILIFICFVGRLLLESSASSSSSFMTSSFLIQMLKMDKRLFKNWVLHIPHHLRDLLWIMRAWYLVAPISSYYESSFFLCVLFLESAKSNHFLQFEVSVLVLELSDLGFVTETLIFKTWNISDLIG